MTNIVLVQEEELRKLVKESLMEVMNLTSNKSDKKQAEEEPLLSRQEIASELHVSLVTLTDWMKKGLPYLRLNGRVYFRRSEVIACMRHHALK